MRDWACPNCDGGFPEPIKWQGGYVCPWCYEELAKHHNGSGEVIEDILEPPTLGNITKSDSGDGDGFGGLFK